MPEAQRGPSLLCTRCCTKSGAMNRCCINTHVVAGCLRLCVYSLILSFCLNCCSHGAKVTTCHMLILCFIWSGSLVYPAASFHPPPRGWGPIATVNKIRGVALGYGSSTAGVPLVHSLVHQGVAQPRPSVLCGRVHFCFIQLLCQIWDGVQYKLFWPQTFF